MSREIEVDYGVQWLFPPSLEDWVAEDHPARFLREWVEGVEGFESRSVKTEEGRPHYGSRLLLRVWL